MARTLYQARAQGIPPLPDVAWMQAPQIPRRRLSRAHLGPSLAMTTQQPVPPADSWLPPVAPATILAAPRVRQSEIIAPVMQPVPSADSWLGAIQRPIMVPRRPQQPDALAAPARQPEPPAPSWLPPVAPSAITRSQVPSAQQQAFFASPDQPVPPADGWLPAANQPPRAAARLLEALQQAVALPGRQPDPVWGWEALAPAWLPVRPPVQAPGFVGPLFFEPPVPPPDFGWFRPPSEPSPHRAFRAFLYGGATLLYAPPIIIARPGRVLPLVPDTRDILLAPDIRTLILPLDEAPMPPVPPQYWSPASADDVDFYWLSLSQWIPPDDTILTPSAAVTPITDDPMPLEVVPGSVVVETGDRRVYVPPGVPVIDPGPRIRMQMQGGTFGKTYTTTITWTDSQGRTINRQALLTIQWP